MKVVRLIAVYVPLAMLANYCVWTGQSAGIMDGAKAKQSNDKLSLSYTSSGLRLGECPFSQQSNAKAGATSDMDAFVAIGECIACNINMSPWCIAGELL